MVRNFVAIILARGDSKGIKLKNLFKINKKPMIFWTIKHCLDSRKIDYQTIDGKECRSE